MLSPGQTTNLAADNNNTINHTATANHHRHAKPARQHEQPPNNSKTPALEHEPGQQRRPQHRAPNPSNNHNNNHQEPNHRLHHNHHPKAAGEQISPRTSTDNKVWSYFESEAGKLKCLLCYTDLLCNKFNNTEPQPAASTRALLWNHLRVEHSIDRTSGTEGAKFREAPSPAKQQQHNNLATKASRSSHSQDTNGIRTSNSRTANATTISTSNNKAPPRDTSTATTRTAANMTNTKKPPGSKFNEPAGRKSSSNAAHNINDLRRNLDLLDYDDLSKASLKPLPTSSLPRNLFERFNQLSSPVTRKLKFWNKKSFQVNQYDPCFKVIYLGNLGVQFWSKDEGCLEKPLNTLWNNYLVNMKTEIVMRLTICNSGLKAITRQHGLTQYWSNRLVYCCSHKNYPKIFSWIYRHEGKKMRQELRCHAVFCSSPERASKMVALLNQRLTCALEEFKREKKSRGQTPSIVAKCNSSLSSSAGAATLLQATLPRTVPLRRQILAKGSANFRPPLERSKSAPKLTSIREEDYEIEEEEEEDEEEDDDDEEVGADGEQGAKEEESAGRARGLVADRQLNGDNDTASDGDDISHDELEYEQSFDDRDEDDDEDDADVDDNDDSNSDYNDAELDKHDDEDSSTHKAESNEETSNSSVYAIGDISYDNIIANRHHLSANHERLDNESTLTAPIILKSSSSFLRRSSLRSSSLNQNESLTSDRTESMSDAGQPDSQPASASSTLNSCHINNTNNNNNNSTNNNHSTAANGATPQENGLAEPSLNHHQNSVAHHFGQIKL